jgi:ABC-type sugar transport system substrate-binding protein
VNDCARMQVVSSRTGYSWKNLPGMRNLRFLVSLMTNENDYQLEQASSAEQAANRLGVEVKVIFAENDAITQSTQLSKAIQVEAKERPDAIVFELVGGVQRCRKWPKQR